MITQLRRRLGITRERVAHARLLAERTALALRPGEPSARTRILCYHSVGQPEYGVNDVTADRFRRQLDLALSQGHRFVPAADAATGGGSAKDLAITFDDGLRSVLETAVPILHEFDVPATCFVVTSWLDHDHQWQRDKTLSWSGVRELADAGVEIGSHSLSHPDFSSITDDDARREMVESGRRISEELGTVVDSFAIPFGVAATWSDELTAMAHSAGYHHVYAQSEDKRPAGTIPRTFITSVDSDRRFTAALHGAYDRWEEWS
ncbi:MAG: polysaccharide deacetylase family protein [Ilumatobacteraceae bacterium]|nr:polysaccharide deacetylase family protein [Ilumatobacteraceae bacterium]